MAGEGSMRTRLITPELLQRVAQAKAHCRKFAVSNMRDAIREVSITIALYVLGIAIFPLLTNSLLWYAGVIFCGLVNARTIVVYHDCNHGSHFPIKSANLWVGRFLGALMGINYDGWYKEHDLEHHSKLGRSEHMFVNDASSTIFITVKSWNEASPARRAVWRVIRSPFVFFTILPTVVFLCGVQNPGKVPGLNYIVGVPPFSVLKTNLIDQILPIAVPILQVMLGRSLFGPGYWSYYAWGKVLGYSIGFIAFHLQHAPAGTHVYYDYPKGEHSVDLAAYLSSTNVKVPWCIRWVFAAIQYHHIHHLNRKIPLYNLRACHDSAPPGTWDGIPNLDYKLVIQSLFTTLYDDDNCCFRSFPEYDWILPDVKPPLGFPQKKSAGLDKADVLAKEE